MMVRTQNNKNSADKTAIGFDYQYYFFLWKILSLRTGQSIGWEVKDDVHIETEKQNYLYQIKHSVQKKKDGGTTNLTTSDKDLWKTISNWVKFIVDENDGRKGIDNQLAFLDKTTFILASNKSSTSRNKFLNGVAEYQDNKKDFSTIKLTVQELLKKTEDKNISEYINTLLKMNDKVFENFLRKLRFELDENDIFETCKEAIKADKIPENKIDDVFSSLDSALRKDNFITITGGEKVLITFDNFYKKFRKYYDIARNDKLLIRPFDGLLPDKLLSKHNMPSLKTLDKEPVSETTTLHKITWEKIIAHDVLSVQMEIRGVDNDILIEKITFRDYVVLSESYTRATSNETRHKIIQSFKWSNRRHNKANSADAKSRAAD